jgi:hypothetical protein
MSESVSDQAMSEMINQICDELKKMHSENKILKQNILKLKTENDNLSDKLISQTQDCLNKIKKIKELENKLRSNSSSKHLVNSDSDSDSDNDSDSISAAACGAVPVQKTKMFDKKKIEELRELSDRVRNKQPGKKI